MRALILAIALTLTLAACDEDIVPTPSPLPAKTPHDAGPCDPVVNKICPAS